MAKMKYCPECEESRGTKHKVCIKCGTDLIAYTDTCFKCRYQVTGEDGEEFGMPALYCPMCGESLEVEEDE